MVKVLSFALALIILASCCHAISMGSLVKERYIKINENETAMFKALFWNVENKTYEIELVTKNTPQNFTVMIKPERFFLDNAKGTEYILLPYVSTAVKAVPVDIIVIPPAFAEGRYNFTIVERIVSNESGIIFLPESSINLVLDILGHSIKNDNDVASIVIETPENITEVKNYDNYENIFYIIIIVAILLISMTIYKLS
jgi:hypothetical protein